MHLPGRPGQDARAVPGARQALFVPMTYADVPGWTRIAARQAEASAACLSVDARIHLMRQELPLGELGARAEPKSKPLEDGTAHVTVTDHLHRVNQAGT